jgi:hypothetical protein
MDDQRLKEAFEKIKLEMNFIKTELFLLKNEFESLKKESVSKNLELYSLLNQLNAGMLSLNSALKETILYIKSNTSPAHPQHSSTYPSKFEGIKPYLAFSNGNEGVPTLPQQTNTQSNTYPADDFIYKLQHIENPQSAQTSKLSIRQLVSMLKEDLKIKFKSLTKQEFYVFSTLFTMEQELNKPLTYRDIAVKTGLTDSTIRDYIARLMAKGIPILKQKSNNKDIFLRVSEELRNLATLDNLSSIKDKEFQ